MINEAFEALACIAFSLLAAAVILGIILSPFYLIHLVLENEKNMQCSEFGHYSMKNIPVRCAEYYNLTNMK